MAGKIKSVYICCECGAESPKWVGKCPKCNQWNTMNEEVISSVKPTAVSSAKKLAAKTINDITAIISPTNIYLSCIPGNKYVTTTINHKARFIIFSLFHFIFL